MPELIETYWPYILLAVVIGFAVGWYVFVANRKTSVTSERRDVLDEGAVRARRNEALINAPPAAENLSNTANTQQVLPYLPRIRLRTRPKFRPRPLHRQPKAETT